MGVFVFALGVFEKLNFELCVSDLHFNERRVSVEQQLQPHVCTVKNVKCTANSVFYTFLNDSDFI